MSVTYTEIKQQYAALRQTFDYMMARREDIEQLVRLRQPASFTVVGCGSGFCLSEAAAFSLRVRGGCPSAALAGGDLMLHAGRYGKLLERTMLLVPSRSGSTTEVVEAIGAARKERPLPVLALSCVTDSPLSRIADLALELPWAFDNSVCQTRTIANLYTADLMIAAFIGRDERLIADIDKAIRQGDAYMARVEQSIRDTADFGWTNAVVLADGELKGLAAEGAIALTEIAKVQAHSHHLLDVRHGPMVTVGPDTLVIAALSAEGTGHQHKLMQEIKERGARIIAFADRESLIPRQFVDLAVVSESELDYAAQGIPFIFIPQIVAVGSADRNGINPDQPDGLTAWVKL